MDNLLPIERKEMLEKVMPFSRYANLRLFISIIGIKKFQAVYEFFCKKSREERTFILPSEHDIARLSRAYEMSKIVSEDKRIGKKTNWSRIARREGFTDGYAAQKRYQKLSLHEGQALVLQAEYI